METNHHIQKMRGLSQIIAMSIKNLLMLIIGMNIGFVTILIPALINENYKQIPGITETEISWISSMIPLSSLIGSIFSGIITEPLGRKRAMMFSTIPYFIAWISNYFATEIWHIYMCLAVHGIMNGLVQAPVLAFAAEITEPRLRGMLSGTSPLIVGLGIFVEFLIGNLWAWRLASLISSVVPILALCLLSILPESPYWLLLREKSEDAQKSLAWFRNWTTIENVEEEFHHIKQSFSNRMVGIDNRAFNGCISRISLSEDLEKPVQQTLFLKMQKFTKKRFLWPLFLLYFLYTLSNFIGYFTLQTFGVVIFATFKVPIDKYDATVLLGVVEFLGLVVSIAFVRFLGKRVMCFISLLGACICNASLAVYSFLHFILYLEFSDNRSIESETGVSWIPLLLLISLAFICHCGAKSLPWMLIGEVFSNDTRSVGCGLATSAYYISGFATNKLYLSMVSKLSLPGVFCTYACICFIGLLVVYFAVPETEGKTLEDIINHFNGSKKLDNKLRR